MFISFSCFRLLTLLATSLATSPLSTSLPILPHPLQPPGATGCFAFAKGECLRGDSCKYSHGGGGSAIGQTMNMSTNAGPRETQRKTKLSAGSDTGRVPEGVCRQFLQGKCARGESCKFQHSVGGGSGGPMPAGAAASAANAKLSGNAFGFGMDVQTTTDITSLGSLGNSLSAGNNATGGGLKKITSASHITADRCVWICRCVCVFVV
jgi:hypothetical protein